MLTPIYKRDPLKFREFLRLRYIDGRSTKEVSQELNITVETVLNWQKSLSTGLLPPPKIKIKSQNNTDPRPIKKLLIDKYLTGAELARRTGYSETYISLLINGHRKGRVRAWKKIYKALGVNNKAA